MSKIPKVLIIEDNEISRRALRAIFNYEEIEVVGEARDGESGLEMLTRLRPDLVCLDVMLPGLDGMAVLEHIRSRSPDLPVLMITGRSEREAVKRMIEAGATDIVLKPFNGANVIAAVKRCLNSKPSGKTGAAKKKEEGGAPQEALAKADSPTDTLSEAKKDDDAESAAS